MDGKKVKLSLEHISQSYILNGKAFDAVQDVNFDVYDSEFLVIWDRATAAKQFCST